MSWERAQSWERDWWGNCVNTFGEEWKQMLYADRMGLTPFHDGKSPFNYDLKGAKILDIGCGPTSLLLRCVNFVGTAIDPMEMPEWVLLRYESAGITFERLSGEDIEKEGFDECWIYNVLQHTRDPLRVLENARRAASLLRIFEWIGTPTNEGHPHTLTEEMLNEALSGEGKVEHLTGQNTCWGVCYYGVFPTKTL